MKNSVEKISKQISEKIGGERPQIAIILGSGLGNFADNIENPITIPYEEIEGFPRSTVQGHEGSLIYGTIAGKKIICMKGRLHLYEGHPASKIALVVHVFKHLGAETMIATNAAGSLREDCPPGSLVLINDHINISFANPMMGENDDSLGPRFFDMTQTYSKDMREKMHVAAKKEGIELPEGVYMMVPGPNFETPAEIRAYRTLGADVIAMSLVPEVIAAVHANMKIIGISSVVNYAAGMTQNQLSHNETLEQANLISGKLQSLLISFIKDY